MIVEITFITIQFSEKMNISKLPRLITDNKFVYSGGVSWKNEDTACTIPILFKMDPYPNREMKFRLKVADAEDLAGNIMEPFEFYFSFEKAEIAIRNITSKIKIFVDVKAKYGISEVSLDSKFKSSLFFTKNRLDIYGA